MGLIVGGPPQPPMVVPQAMEQLLRRPPMLAQAQAAARAGDDDLLLGFVLEAMRFDPLAPGLPRTVLARMDDREGNRTPEDRTSRCDGDRRFCFGHAGQAPRARA